MNFSDFIIIYLACGAPFGVYFFLQNRTKLKSFTLWLNSFLTAVVWFPYAFRFLHTFVTGMFLKFKFSKIIKSDLLRKRRIETFEKKFAQMLRSAETGFSLFDFRETFQRYAGLTQTFQTVIDWNETGENEKEVFRAAGHEKVELAAKCLHRRNLKRLQSHQSLARTDLIQMLCKLDSQLPDSGDFRRLVTEFVQDLNDVEAQKSFDDYFLKTSQTGGESVVNISEQDLWKTEAHKPLSASSIPLNLHTMSATGAIRKQD